MSVVKSKRSKSSIEFERLYFLMTDGMDNLVQHDFWAEGLLAEKNRKFLDARANTLQKLTDDLLFHIKVANSIYPTCMLELEERRLSMDRAIGTCFTILTCLQRIMQRLRIPDNKYTLDITNIQKLINSLKAWRKSDNKFKVTLRQQSA